MRPVLSDTLSVLLPTEEETLLMRACLYSGDAGRRAWHEWMGRVGAAREELARRPILARLLPLLHVATKRYGAEVEPEFAFCLRAAYYQEELRSAAYRDALGNVLRVLDAASVNSIVLNGPVLAETIYGDWALRHCHDIDLLVSENCLSLACRALEDAGIVTGARLLHHSELPIELHADLFPLPPYQRGSAAMIARRETIQVAGLSAQVLSPCDQFLHVCGHAACSESRPSLQWASDAWFIAARCASLDWDCFLDGAVRTRLALPLYVLLGYLLRDLDAAIPQFVVQALGGFAQRVGRTAREAAVFGARSSYRGFRTATTRWRSRVFLLRWRLFPTPSYLRWTVGVASQRAVCLLYWKRAVRCLMPSRWAAPAGPHHTRQGGDGAPKPPPRRRRTAIPRRPWQPTDEQVLLVEAALLDQDSAIDAWDRWRSSAQLDRIDDGSAALLPIVYRNLAEYGVSDSMLRHARRAYQIAWLTNERLFDAISTLLADLREEGIKTMILKGTALALLYYQDLGLRSLGDVDLLIRPHDVTNAINTLTRLGWTKTGRTPRVLTQTYLSARRAIHFSSDRIAKLDLHWHVMDESCGLNADRSFWINAIPTAVRGVQTCAMCPTDQLLHVCAHEARWTPVALPRWIVDAITILRASPRELDWIRLVSHAQRLGLVLPVREALEGVLQVVDAPIPSSVLNDLHRVPLSRSDHRAHAIRSLPPSPLRLLETEYRRLSLELARKGKRYWILFLPSYARALWGLDRAWQLPLHVFLWGARTLWRFASHYGQKLIERSVRGF
jgi:hypothetical protein